MVEDFWKNAKLNFKPFVNAGGEGKRDIKLELYVLGDNEEIL